MRRFKIGDSVICTWTGRNNKFKDKIGTIVDHFGNTGNWVLFDEDSLPTQFPDCYLSPFEEDDSQFEEGFEKYTYNFKNFVNEKYEYQTLAGVALILDEEYILIVLPRKYVGKGESMWSIPKGKNEFGDLINTALTELYEETGIKFPIEKINKNKSIEITYKKGGKVKTLTTYVVEINKYSLNYLGISLDKNNEIKIENNKEIYKCGFFNFQTAQKKLEPQFVEIIKRYLEKDYEESKGVFGWIKKMF